MAQWEAILKNRAWNEGPSIEKIICSDGEINLAA